MARVGDASASSVVTADVVACPPTGYLRDGKLAPGDPLDNQHPVATLHDPLARLRNCGRRRWASPPPRASLRTFHRRFIGTNRRPPRVQLP